MQSRSVGSVEKLIYALPGTSENGTSENGPGENGSGENGTGARRRACDQQALRLTLDRSGAVLSRSDTAAASGFAEAPPDGRGLSEVVAEFGECSCDLDALFSKARDQGWAELECWAVRPDATRIWCGILITCFGTDDGATQGYAMVLRDLSERKRRETELHRMAETDPLTGILNRRSFMSLAAEATERRRADPSRVAFAMLDLDRFKQINDRYGHAVGDIALTRVVGCISRNLRNSDLLGRLGGDEFGLLLTGMTHEQVSLLLQRLQQIVLAETVLISGQRLDLSVSFGFSMGRPGEQVAGLMVRADRALIASKQLGRRRIRLTR
ncbi:MAG: GGDEF domain-containing protein [Pseudomonadota bacterium]